LLESRRGYTPVATKRPVDQGDEHMRLARKTMLLAMLALAASALASPSVFGHNTEPLLHNQTPRLIVQQEVHAANDVACPAVLPTPAPNPSPLVTSGGCRFHISGLSINFSEHTSAGAESIITTCNIEADARIDAAGEGYLTHQELTQGVLGTCTRRACAQPTPPTGEGRAWSFYMQETEPAPRERMVILFCLETLTTPTSIIHCEFTLPIAQTTTHMYEFVTNDLAGHNAPNFPRCEITGILRTEEPAGLTGENQARQNIEIRHT
jgi:hypothetical protein